MLTRPLAYKGPVDHLSQYFAIPVLYQGLQNLLQDELVDWRYLAEQELVEGVFVGKDGLFKVQLTWPLRPINESSFCEHCTAQSESTPDDSPCVHMAALAIESKMRLERLPQPIKQNTTFVNELGYLSDWLSKQQFDPFPNMARHRVVYLLDGEPGEFVVTVHKAYLTQKNEYQRKAEIELAALSKNKLPKYVSLTDQQIIQVIQQTVSIYPSLAFDSNGVKLQFDQSADLLHLMIASGRCFWRTCHRQPLALHFLADSQPSWWQIDDNLWLDRSHSRVVSVMTVLPDRAQQLFQDIAMQKPDIIPCLSIASQQLVLPHLTENGKKSAAVDIDVAKVRFKFKDIEFQLQELLNWLAVRGKAEENLFLEKIAAYLHQLDWLPSIAANYQQPITQHFDIADRYLEGDFSHWFVLFRGLQQEGWQINFERSFALNEKHIQHWYSRVAQQEIADQSMLDDQDWFELEIGVVVDGRSINVLPFIVNALKHGQWQESSELEDIAVTLDDGTRIKLEKQRIQAILTHLVELNDNRPLTTHHRLKMPANQFSRLLQIEQHLADKTEWQDLQWLKEKADRLAQADAIKPVKIPHNVCARLRDYQQQGFNWLQMLQREGLAGILADDMGLGKTLQTLTHIQFEKNLGRMTTPALVVAPTSLLGNWLAEAKKFTPELRVLQWAGNKRQQHIEQLPNYDLIVTSYGVLLRDAEVLNQLGIYLLVLDEAQTIKNARSRIARLTYAMQSQHRLCLTGTPLENHLGELWSLFHFLMPGFLGDEAQFKRLFRIPIEKENDRIRQRQLSSRVAPFMMRRTKDKVATDLPAKTTIYETIELAQSQADIYETVRLSMLDEVQKALAQIGGGKNQLLIGNALLRLRQICCHPGLVQLSGSESKELESAKLNWLMTTLPEMIAAGQKVLIFSSFTSMLDIIAEKISELGIDYFMLTGQTRDRQSLVDKFQAGEVPVFLISLKAGGAGLNLTRADTVIHFDPWWNPAAEEQASDRAHRIGQDKPVFVYKLISKGTVEERIQLLQSQKSDLATQLYQQPESLSQFSHIDWQSLLAPLEDS